MCVCVCVCAECVLSACNSLSVFVGPIALIGCLLVTLCRYGFEKCLSSFSSHQQLPLDNTFNNLGHLDACMLACYCHGDAPALPTPVEPGVICAAPSGGGWYRAQVVDVFDPSSGVASADAASSTTESESAVENGDEDESSSSSSPTTTTAASSTAIAQVRYVDYGGYSDLPVTALRQIRADFLTLPFQAVECYLANLSPPNEESPYEFPMEGAFFLEQLVRQAQAADTRPGTFGVKAEVVAYCEGDMPCVYLYPISSSSTNSSSSSAETSSSSEESSAILDKLSFNESLVHHGHAKFIPWFDNSSTTTTETSTEGEEVVVEDLSSTTTTTVMPVEEEEEEENSLSKDLYKSLSTSFTEFDAASAKIFTPKAKSTTMPTTTTTNSFNNSVIDDVHQKLSFEAPELDVQNDFVNSMLESTSLTT